MSRRAVPMILAAVLTLVMTVPAAAEDPAPIPFTITIDRFGSFTPDGQAVITGTVLCDPEFGVVGFDMNVVQSVGSRHGHGGWSSGDGFMICDGTVHEWTDGAVTSRVDRQGNYLFKAGPAFVWLGTHNGEASAEGPVHLRPIGK
jgi:Family of unknown function (DUF6299)